MIQIPKKTEGICAIVLVAVILGFSSVAPVMAYNDTPETDEHTPEQYCDRIADNQKIPFRFRDRLCHLGEG